VIAAHTPDGTAHRGYGPLHRLDHHTPPADEPAIRPDGRSVLYVAGTLATALGEVFGDVGEAAIRPRFRVALQGPRTEIVVLDLRSEGAAMRIGRCLHWRPGPTRMPLTQLVFYSAPVKTGGKAAVH
jgi:hypothetical protein